MKRRRINSDYNKLTVKGCELESSMDHRCSLNSCYLTCTSPSSVFSLSSAGDDIETEKWRTRMIPVASLKTNFMTVSVHVGPLLSLLISVNGIKELIHLLDIILKWDNAGDYAYHRDVGICVCICMSVCTFSSLYSVF